MSRYRPKKYYAIVAVILIVTLLLLFWYFKINLAVAYLISVSAVAFLFYGWDKNRAAQNDRRIPEIVLHLLAFIGGSPGAFLGQVAFRHKIRKMKFKIVFVLIVLVQILVLAGYWSYRQG